MSLTLVTDATVYPITTAEAKTHLNVDFSDDDTYIDALIAAATEQAEIFTGRDFCQKTWDYSFDQFPTGDIVLPKYPVQSVTSITYTDQTTSPVTNTLSTTVYSLDSGKKPSVIYQKYGQYWPSATSQHNSITVRFITGAEPTGSPLDYRANVPEAIKTAIKVIITKLYDHRGETSVLFEKDSAELLLLNSYRIWSL